MKKTKTHATDWSQIERFLQSADKKILSARKILEFDDEAALQQAYEAMLRAAMALMFSHGTRIRSQPGHHIAIIEFARASLGREHDGMLSVFDHMRRKRNTALYDDTGFISHRDAEDAVDAAQKFVAVAKKHIESRKSAAT
jgi:uncharacterized protein (UPF0332 family)